MLLQITSIIVEIKMPRRVTTRTLKACDRCRKRKIRCVRVKFSSCCEKCQQDAVCCSLSQPLTREMSAIGYSSEVWDISLTRMWQIQASVVGMARRGKCSMYETWANTFSWYGFLACFSIEKLNKEWANMDKNLRKVQKRQRLHNRPSCFEVITPECPQYQVYHIRILWTITSPLSMSY